MLEKFKSYYINWILFGIGLLVFSAAFRFFYQDENWSKYHQVSHFEEELNKADQRLLNEIDYYYSIIDTSNLETLLNGGVSYHKRLEREGYGVYIYSDSNLKFWSTNKLVVPVELYNGVIEEQNGFYIQQYKVRNELTIIARFFIKKKYDFQNSYVQNSFNENLYLKKDWRLSKLPSDKSIEIKINSTNEKIYLKPSTSFKRPFNVLLMFLEGIGIISFLIGCVLLSKKLSLVRKFIFIPSLLVSLRIVLLKLNGPLNLHDLEIFKPKLLAFSSLVPSLGDLLLFVVFSLVLSFSLLKSSNFYSVKLKKYKLLILFFGYLAIYLFTLGIIKTIKGVVLFSEIPLDLSHILSINYTTIIALFCISALLANYLIICWKLIALFNQLQISVNKVVAFYLFGITISTLLGALYGFSDIYELLWSIPVVVLVAYSYYKNDKYISFSVSISLLFLFSLMTTHGLRDYTDSKTIDDKKRLLSKLGKEKDLIAEYLFQGVQLNIKRDNRALELVSDYSISDQDVFKYFKENYFNGFWDKFDLQVNPCFDGDSVLLMEKHSPVSCEDFFQDIIVSVGSEVAPNFFYLENENGRISYIGVIEFSSEMKIYLEFDYKFKPDGVGFPTLLLDEQIERKSLNPDYSFAHFKSGDLLKQKGILLYSTNLSYYKFRNELEWDYFQQDGIGHLVKINGDDVYFLSQKKTSVWDQMAFYSYLFAFFSILTIIVMFLYRFLYGKVNKGSSFKTRFQSIIIFILFFSTVFIGFGSIYYLKSQYNQKNFDAISEKIKSVQIEVEQKFGGSQTIEKIELDYVHLILEKFSKVFFTDINVYNPNGKLIASSQNQIFEKGLIGQRMDPLAMYQMLFNAQSQFVQIEEIEGMQFLSAYVPFYNNEGHLMAYLNLPYFARSDDLKNEISDFIVALLNIYALLIVIALVIGLILTNRITEPLRLIQEKMANIQLGQTNEFINYNGKDEIGRLVNEYNRMIIEISESAKRLAESEREDAWREMAKQVAHEIKNPLTPMKLSIQHLQMRWSLFTEDEKNKRFQSFGKNLIQQIDTLSAIATEFSSFAKLPETSFSRIDLAEIIRSSVDVYNGTDNVRVTFLSEIELSINGDKDQMLRVFNNLIKNAIQAIPEDRDGKVQVYSIQNECGYTIIVEDNGKGISVENESRIFVPNFTTKNSGMGLGLAMVQKIIENMGGKIHFESEEGKWTKFMLEFS